MAKWGSCDFSQLKKLADRLDKLEAGDLDAFTESVAKDLGARLLRLVKERTPKGEKPEWVDPEILQKYWSGYSGGELKRKWTVLTIEKQGDAYVVTIVNPMEYASDVEYGHITPKHGYPQKFVPAIGKTIKYHWVPGRFMLRLSLEDLEKNSPVWVERKLNRFLKEVFNSGQ